MAAISMPQRRQVQSEPETSPLDYLMKGLNIAGSVYGLYSDTQKLDDMKKSQAIQQEQATREREKFVIQKADKAQEDSGVLSEGAYMSKAEKNWTPVKEPGSEGPTRPDPTVRKYTIERKTADGKTEQTPVWLRTPQQAKQDFVASESEKKALAAQDKSDKDRSARTVLAKQQYDWAVNRDGAKADLQRELAGRREKLANNPTKLNEFQTRSAGFAERAMSANADFDSLVGEGYDRASLSEDVKANFLFEPLKGEALKRQEQAEKNFMTAKLRLESGAAISMGEFKTDAAILFPRGGDTPAVLAQKARTRDEVIRGLMRGAGPGAATIQAPTERTNAPQKNPAAIRTQPTEAAQPTADDSAALNWLMANPNDPRAPSIRETLKAKGVDVPTANPANAQRVPWKKMG